MAFFGVTKEVVERVWAHPNADRLDLAKIRGLSFQFVVGKGLWKEGDECLYFPVDSLFPEGLLLAMGVGELVGEEGAQAVVGKLSGPNKNRLKTVRLRGEISQGMIGPLSLIDGLEEHTPEKITEFLGVQKYEPPILFDANGDLVPLPDGLSAYDIEGADRYEAVLGELMDLPVAITEKVEGTNFSVYVDSDGNQMVNQRRYSIRPKEGVEHSFWKIAKSKGLFEVADEIRQRYNGQACAIYGEFVGPNVQKNIYGLKEHRVLVFDILITGNVDNGDEGTRIDSYFLPWKKFMDAVHEFELDSVPVLEEDRVLRDILDNKTVQDFSNGKSKLFGVRREGIVIKPIEERYNDSLGGRLILKQRSPDYLAKTDH